MLSIQGNSCITSGWSVHQLTPAPGYACALVSEGPVGRLRCFSERISRCSSH
ncbi:Uncharacterized protein dnm_036880 [Desulfonema magnum]|uniref:Uncharacterized protein n=1 Tax=Desulfonema magnum TaxID=45655 RepID=A0A975BMC9_9BACT|nr:Uncharacterized protein dnm_036880 [Desulfonema magnum]